MTAFSILCVAGFACIAVPLTFFHRVRSASMDPTTLLGLHFCVVGLPLGAACYLFTVALGVAP